MRRIWLWVGFAVASFVVAFFFAGAGHRSYAPFTVFCAWGSLPWLLLVESAKNPNDLLLGLAFCVVPVVYLAGLFAGSRWLVAHMGRRFYAAAAIFHLLGAVVGSIPLEHGHLATPRFIVVSYLVALVILLAFFALDYRLLSAPAEDVRTEPEQTEQVQHQDQRNPEVPGGELTQEARSYLASLRYDVLARRLVCQIPLAGIYWEDEIPDWKVIFRLHQEERDQILRLFGIRMRIWDQGQPSTEDQPFWDSARKQIPDCPIFQRLDLSDEDQKAQEKVFAEVADFFSQADGLELGDDGKTFTLTYDLTNDRSASGAKREK